MNIAPFRIAALLIGLLSVTATLAAAPKALKDGAQPKDARLQPPKDLNGYFPFTPPKSAEEWHSRAERLRRQILVSQGLWPQPTKTPLNAVVHGKLDRGDHTVEKVFFEAMPGYFVTGSLYRPVGKEGKRPAVLRPHGHWANGRFHDKGLAEVRKEIEQGAEKFEEGGRSPLQAMNVQLARMGCVVFHYDMIGYADSTQLSFQLAHRFDKQRPEMNTVENWGLFSPQADAHLQSIMGLQTWGSIRALDFVTSLPEVDIDRIGVTGASGGGTQTFMLCAIDPRPAAAFPAVMVSTAMQGGCTCENASCLRVHAGNVDFAALFAPKPLGMTAANDWTKEMETKGFPELKKHYELLKAPDNVKLTALLQYGHNYNYPSRAAMYAWFNRHLGINLPEPVVELDYKRLTQEELTVWDDKHPRPESGPELERKLLAWWHNDAQEQLKKLQPSDAASLRKYRDVVGGALDVLLGRTLPSADDLEYEATSKDDAGKYLVIAGLVRNRAWNEELPLVFLHPKDWNGQAVIWLDDAGKAGLYAESGELKPQVAKLVASGVSVVGVDLFMQGEFLTDGKLPSANREVQGNREFPGYTYGYNSSLLAQRVHDVLTTVVFCSNHQLKPKSIDLIGLAPQVGPIATVARAEARDLVRRAAIDTHGFRFGKLLDYRDVSFLPGGAKYGDLPGFLALSAGDELLLAGEGDGNALLTAAYKAAGSPDKLTFVNNSGDSLDKVVQWLSR
jgi:hypothetical protein